MKGANQLSVRLITMGIKKINPIRRDLRAKRARAVIARMSKNIRRDKIRRYQAMNKLHELHELHQLIEQN